MRRSEGLPKLNIKNCRTSVTKNQSTKLIRKDNCLPKR